MDYKLNEHILFHDLPCGKSGKFHSAVLTTYSMDLIYFDSYLCKVLHRKQICSINVFADASQIDTAMDHVSPTYLRNIGCDYAVTNISSEGAFHPKINFFAGEDAVLVLIGSGNLTVPGQGKNHEAFTGFMVEGDNKLHQPLILECWEYLKRLAQKGGEFEKRRLTQEIPDNCKWLKHAVDVHRHRMWPVADGLEAALLYHDEESSILRQISAIVPMEKVKRITVSSPFFDADGSTLHLLADLCPKAKVDVLIQKVCTLPPCNMNDDERIKFYDFDETKRGKMKIKNFDRLAHVKFFLFDTQDKQYCIIGSSNATKPGLGTLYHRGVNEEFCIIYASDDRDFLGMLGLRPSTRRVLAPQNMSRQAPSSGSRRVNNVYLLSAFCLNNVLTVVCAAKSKLTDGLSLVVDDGISQTSLPVASLNERQMCINIEVPKSSTICYLRDSFSQVVSNRIIVNKLESLEATNPSRRGRIFSQIVAKIENDGYSGIEIADMLTSLMCDTPEESDYAASKHQSSGSSKQKENDDLPEIDFNADQNVDKLSVIKSIDHSSRLVEFIEDSIRRRLKAIDDEIMDEEETASKEIGNKRTYEESRSIPVKHSGYQQFAKTASKVLNDYSRLIDRRTAQMLKNATEHVSKADFNFFSISMFVAVEICGLKRLRYDFGEMESSQKSIYQKDLFCSLNRCLDIDCLNVLEKFVRFCKRFCSDVSNDDDLRYCAHRAIKYMLVYAAVFDRNTTNRVALEKRVIAACSDLIAILGVPDTDMLKDQIDPLAERYDRRIDFPQIERILKKLCNC